VRTPLLVVVAKHACQLLFRVGVHYKGKPSG
jgi:hypothetical protein